MFFVRNHPADDLFWMIKMQRYHVVKQVGDGTYGSVWKAVDRYTNEIVAIKKMKMKFYMWADCINLREVKCLQMLNHPNIVQMKEVIWEKGELYLVFEFMDCNLYQVMKDKSRPLSEDTIRAWSFQVLRALDYMHQNGIFHRDLKPENLLVSGNAIKIADFGLAREAYSRGPYTDYVATRWYRAPEVLLQSSSYSFAIDIWAMGAIMAELFTSRPLFPGASEADELFKICTVLGTPDMYTWPEGMKLANGMNYLFPQCLPSNLRMVIPNASPAAINMISAMLTWDPARRPTAYRLLQHPFFHPLMDIQARAERPFVINIDEPSTLLSTGDPRTVFYSGAYNPLYNTPLQLPQELCLFPPTKLKTPQPAYEAPGVPFCELVGAPFCVKTAVPPGLGMGSKHVSCPPVSERNFLGSHYAQVDPNPNEYEYLVPAPSYHRQPGFPWDLPV